MESNTNLVSIEELFSKKAKALEITEESVYPQGLSYDDISISHALFYSNEAHVFFAGNILKHFNLNKGFIINIFADERELLLTNRREFYTSQDRLLNYQFLKKIAYFINTNYLISTTRRLIIEQTIPNFIINLDPQRIDIICNYKTIPNYEPYIYYDKSSRKNKYEFYKQVLDHEDEQLFKYRRTPDGYLLKEFKID
jgi:hypothetical protein